LGTWTNACIHSSTALAPLISTTYIVSLELLKNQISLHGVVVLHGTTALPTPVQPKNSSRHNAAKWIRRAERILDSHDLGEAAGAAACVPVPYAAAAVRSADNVLRDKHTDAVGAAMQGAVIPDSPLLTRPPTRPRRAAAGDAVTIWNGCFYRIRRPARDPFAARGRSHFFV
jgi:hypothetical protein